MTFVVGQLLTYERREAAVSIDLARCDVLTLLFETLAGSNIGAGGFYGALLCGTAGCAHRGTPNSILQELFGEGPAKQSAVLEDFPIPAPTNHVDVVDEMGGNRAVRRSQPAFLRHVGQCALSE